MLAQWRCEITPAEQFPPLWGCGEYNNSQRKTGRPPLLFVEISEGQSGGEKYYDVTELSQLHLSWPGSQAGTEPDRANNHQACSGIYHGTPGRLL